MAPPLLATPWPAWWIASWIQHRYVDAVLIIPLSCFVIQSPLPPPPSPVPFVPPPPFSLTPPSFDAHPPLPFPPALKTPKQMPGGAIRDPGPHNGPMAAGLQAGLQEGGEAMLHHYHPHHHPHHPPHGPPPPPPRMVMGRGRGRGGGSRGGDPWAQEFMQMPPDAR